MFRVVETKQVPNTDEIFRAVDDTTEHADVVDEQADEAKVTQG